MQVRVVGEIAAPGVQRHEQAGHDAQATRVGHDLQEAVTSGGEQQLGHEGAVVGPKREQLVWEGEDGVEVGAGEQAQELRVDPARASRLGAPGARAVVAGMGLNALVMALRALQQMGP